MKSFVSTAEIKPCRFVSLTKPDMEIHDEATDETVDKPSIVESDEEPE